MENLISGAVAEKVGKILQTVAVDAWTAWNQSEREEFLRSGAKSGLVWKYGAAAPESWPVAASMAEAEALVTVTRAKAAAAVQAVRMIEAVEGVDEAAAILGAVRRFLAEEAEGVKAKVAAEAEAAVAVATRQWEVVMVAERMVSEAEEALEAVVATDGEFSEGGWWWRKQLEDRKGWEAIEGRAAEKADEAAAAWVALLRRAG